MKDHFRVFVEDLRRLGPLVAVSFALVVNMENLMHLLKGQLNLAYAAERFALALALGVVAIRGLTTLLLRYGRQAALNEPERTEEPIGTRSA